MLENPMYLADPPEPEPFEEEEGREDHEPECRCYCVGDQADASDCELHGRNR